LDKLREIVLRNKEKGTEGGERDPDTYSITKGAEEMGGGKRFVEG